MHPKNNELATSITTSRNLNQTPKRIILKSCLNLTFSINLPLSVFPSTSGKLSETYSAHLDHLPRRLGLTAECSSCSKVVKRGVPVTVRHTVQCDRKRPFFTRGSTSKLLSLFSHHFWTISHHLSKNIIVVLHFRVNFIS